jgi:SAM-dependent methyltransferase
MDEHHYLIRGGIAGRERMRVVGRVMRPSTLRLLERVGVSEGMRCLDVGCGAGEVTFDLASLVGPNGQVVGVDLDETKLDLARRDAEQAAVGNVEFRLGDAGAGMGEAAYDVVYARFLLTHVPDPEGVLRLMVAAAQPGGCVVVEDIDYGGTFDHPTTEDFDRYREIYVESARANGGDALIGRRLPLMLTRAGLERVDLDVVQPSGLEGEVTVIPALTLENIKATAARHGIAGGDEVDRLVDALYAIARDPEAFVASPRIVQVWARKPGL